MLFKQTKHKTTMNKRKLFFQVIILLNFLFLASCSYKYVEPETGPIIDPNESVSFASQVVTIFNDNSKCTTCHKTGGQKPDLTIANAYNQITTLGLINSADAGQSKIYSFPEPNSSIHSWKKYTNSEAQIVLLWLNQGAKNN